MGAPVTHKEYGMKRYLAIGAALLLIAALGGTAIAAHRDFGIPKKNLNGIKDAVRSDGSLKPDSVGDWQLKDGIVGCEKLARYLRPRVCGKLGFATGPAGKNGSDGAAGANGLQGALGDAGPAGPTGDTGATGATGPRGPKGYKGHDGKDGENGKDGQDGTLEGLTLSPACEVGNSIHPGTCEDNDAAGQGVDVFVLKKDEVS